MHLFFAASASCYLLFISYRALFKSLFDDKLIAEDMLHTLHHDSFSHILCLKLPVIELPSDSVIFTSKGNSIRKWYVVTIWKCGISLVYLGLLPYGNQRFIADGYRFSSICIVSFCFIFVVALLMRFIPLFRIETFILMTS